MQHQTVALFAQNKGYCDKNIKAAKAIVAIVAKRNLHLVAIKKNNMIDKNKDLDKGHCKLRSPYEIIFSKINRRVMYQGIQKSQSNAFMERIAHNFKRMVVLGEFYLPSKIS
jgi:hypothetical protein